MDNYNGTHESGHFMELLMDGDYKNYCDDHDGGDYNNADNNDDSDNNDDDDGETTVMMTVMVIYSCLYFIL